MECIHCRKELAETDQSIKVFLFAQSFGMRPRLKSGAEYIVFCPPCAASLAFGPIPEGALYQAAWRRLRHLVGADNAVAQLAWDGLHSATNPPQLPEKASGGPVITLPYGEAARVA
ncbi:MAG TPA: hypothetical protein VE866_15265 [Candidatus Binatia bacterium]|nr:hypothetical protein [Candidatus Binatia bacterium]